MKADRLIVPLAVASVVISLADLFTAEWAVVLCAIAAMIVAARVASDRRLREERERRYRIRLATWQAGDRR